jgi:uncharacterized cofD-like protein
VCIGGGTGQSNAIHALTEAGFAVSAIVAMVDDGGSTGIIRQEMGTVPPGDVRKCLVAMSDPARAPLARAFERRFAFADNHALGNLVLASLAEECGSFARAVELCSAMLGCRGAVLPSTLENVVLCGTTRDGLEFRGQTSLGTGPCALSRVWLSPREPAAYQPAVDAIMRADVVVLGPGSLFTSVIPNLLVPQILEALHTTDATTVYVCSLADMQGESWGLTAEEHVDALLAHGMEGYLDVVLLHKPGDEGQGIATRCFQRLTLEQVCDDAARRAADLAPNVDDDPDPDWYFRPVTLTADMVRRIEERVPTVIVRDFADGPDQPTWHDLGKLANVVKGVVASCRSPQR